MLTVNRTVFLEKFDKLPFLIEHSLCDHPLFNLERLLSLSNALPTKSVEYNAGELPIGCDPSQTPSNGLSAEETIRRIETCKSWLVLKNVEQDPDYRALLSACLGEISSLSEQLRLGMMQEEGFIFVSSPNSITPYHFDPEHNFLLQIRGSKTMTTFDRGVVSAQERESYFTGAHRNLNFDEMYMTRSQAFELRPGQGLHVPTTMPHFVRNGPAVSISFSITFRTPDLFRSKSIYQFNRMLRRSGIAPSDVGVSPVRDAAKSLAWRVSRSVAQDAAPRGHRMILILGAEFNRALGEAKSATALKHPFNAHCRAPHPARYRAARRSRSARSRAGRPRRRASPSPRIRLFR